jgi:KDO2-lipid IV(A) lauroyltransferase
METLKTHGWTGHSMNTGRIFSVAEWICCRVPRGLLHRCTDLVMLWAALALKGPREAVRANLRVIRPELTPKEINRLARRTFRNYGRSVADFLRYANRPEVPLEHLFSKVVGLEECMALLDRGKGLILAAAHLGSWEIGGQVFSRFGHTINALAISEDDPAVEQMRLDKRAHRGVKTMHVGEDLGTLFRIREVLARNEVVALLADRHHGRDRITVEFFGRPTDLLRSPALISRFAGTPIVPCAILMDGAGRYQALTTTPLEPPAGPVSDEECARETMQALARVFEGWIREHPDQWFNFYPYWGEEGRG